MRFLLPIALTILAGGLSATNAAETASGTAMEKLVEKPGGPLAPDDQALDDLFSRLKKERNLATARAVAEQIRETFAISDSATVDMLMASAGKAVNDKRYGAALDFLDQVTLLQPDFAEGWNRRATVHYVMGNTPKAMADTAHVLALEPRHLGALAGLGGMLEESGRDSQALEAWEKYLSLYPADRDAQKRALALINKLAGQKT